MLFYFNRPNHSFRDNRYLRENLEEADQLELDDELYTDEDIVDTDPDEDIIDINPDEDIVDIDPDTQNRLMRKGSDFFQTKDFTIEFQGNKGILTSYYKQTSNVKIPKKYGDITITEISPDAFLNGEGITSIELPDTIEVIPGTGTRSEGIFSKCTNLQSIKLPCNLQRIGANAFRGCRNLTKIDIPSTVTTIDDYAFSDTGLQSVIIPSETRNLGDGIFYRCEFLEKLDIKSKKLSMIPSNFCCVCYKLSDIKLPSTVAEIGTNAFAGCFQLTSFPVSKKLTIIGAGAFVSTGLKSLASVEDKYILPNLKRIENSAFSGCRQLTTFGSPQALPKLEVICSCAFSGCTKLEFVGLPKSITKVEKGAFLWCQKLGRVAVGCNLGAIDSTAFEGTNIDLTNPDSMSEKGSVIEIVATPNSNQVNISDEAEGSDL